MLRKTILAIYRTVFSRLERHFALFLAISTDGLVHLSRATAKSIAILISHVTPLSILRQARHLGLPKVYYVIRPDNFYILPTLLFAICYYTPESARRQAERCERNTHMMYTKVCSLGAKLKFLLEN